MAQHTIEDIKTIVGQYWGGRAANFDQGASHGLLNDAQHGAWLDLLRPLAGPSASKVKVLDVGCGTGFLSILLAELGHTAVGIDLSDEMLALARQKTQGTNLAVTFRHGDAEHPPVDDAPYDLIIERHVIWTLPQPQMAMRAWHALLKPGGLAVLIEGIFDMPAQSVYEPFRDQLPLYGGHPSADIIALLEAEGFVGTAVTSLMEPTLWTQMPSFPRFMVTGRRRACNEAV